MAQELTTPLQREVLKHCARMALDLIRFSKTPGASQTILSNLAHCATAHCRVNGITLPPPWNAHSLRIDEARKFRAWCLSQLNRPSSETSTQQ